MKWLKPVFWHGLSWWSLSLITSGGLLAAITLINPGMLNLFSGGGAVEVIRNAAGLLSLYSMLVAVIMAPLIFTSYYQTYLPLIVTLNCSRKKAVGGVQILKLQCVAGLLIINILLQAVSGWGVAEGRRKGCLELLLALFCIQLIGCSLGEVFGAVYLKFGKWGMIGMIILSACFGGAGGYLISSGVFNGEMEIVFIFGAMWKAALPIALISWIVCAVVAWKLIKNVEVRS